MEDVFIMLLPICLYVGGVSAPPRYSIIISATFQINGRQILAIVIYSSICSLLQPRRLAHTFEAVKVAVVEVVVAETCRANFSSSSENSS